MENAKPNVLFIDDDEGFARHLVRSIERRELAIECHTAHNEEQALKRAEQVKPDVIVVDLALDPTQGPESGLSLISKLFGVLHSVRILVLTGNNQAEWGIRSINSGAASFLTKPVDMGHLTALIEDGINVAKIMRENEVTNQALLSKFSWLGLNTKSEKMLKVHEQVAFAAATPQPVLLCGETGVGKGVIAHAIHRASKRADGRFVRTQPSFGSYDLINSELFGHTRGAFTGASEARTGLVEQANGGTLFLDEIDLLPQQTQILLLNVLQEKEFQRIGSSSTHRSDFRLVSATNTPFGLLCGESRLRADFYHRIAHLVIHIPPLRERRADIPGFAREHVIKLASDDKESCVFDLTNEACSWLAAQPWPGNIRELLATVERGYTQAQFHNRRFVSLGDIQTPLPPRTTSSEASLSEQLRTYELTIASSALAKNRHNFSATARELGIDRKRLKRIFTRAECEL